IRAGAHRERTKADGGCEVTGSGPFRNEPQQRSCNVRDYTTYARDAVPGGRTLDLTVSHGTTENTASYTPRRSVARRRPLGAIRYNPVTTWPRVCAHAREASGSIQPS